MVDSDLQITPIIKPFILELINNHDDLKIDEVSGQNVINITIRPHKDDLAMIYGKKGFNIKTIQNMAYIIGSRKNKKVHLTVLD